MRTFLSLLFAMSLAGVLGGAVSVLMTRAANLSAAANVVIGGAVVLILAVLLFLAVVAAERYAFGS